MHMDPGPAYILCVLLRCARDEMRSARPRRRAREPQARDNYGSSMFFSTELKKTT